jgi:hypothetical protein
MGRRESATSLQYGRRNLPLDRIWEKRFDSLVNSPQYVVQLLLSL